MDDFSAKKKRKRTDELSVRSKPDSPAGPKKSKKVVVGQDAAGNAGSGPHVIKVSSVVQSQISPPVIVTTPGIVLPDNAKFNSYGKSANSQKSSNPSAPKELLLHSESHRTMDYTAREDQSKGSLKHYIGVFDVKTGELQIIEARKMTVRGTVRSRRAADEALAQPKQHKTMRDLRNELGQTFGTKKAKKAIMSITENAILRANGTENRLDQSEQALMDSIKESTASVLTREELQALTDESRPVPKGNYEADVIQDVYKPEDIIGVDVLNAIPIRDWQEKVDNDEEVILGSAFAAHRLVKVATGPSPVQRLRLLRYYYYALTFLKCASSKGRGPKKLPRRDELKNRMGDAPEVVIENIRRKFSERGEILKAHVDLLITHLCVFACIIDNFEVDTLDVRDDLGLEPKVMAQYFNEVGAKARLLKRAGKTVQMATLSLPLEFPKLRIVRQGRR